MGKRDNETVAHEMKQWFLHCLGCAAGIREFSLGRYTIAVLDETTLSDSLIQTYQQFLLDLRAYRRVGCLFVFNVPSLYEEQAVSTRDVLQKLAEYMSILTDVSPETLLCGGNFNKKLTLPCPVTGRATRYEDFDAIAFCPQAHRKADPLYDPLMAAPYPCVNFNSDLFGFAMYVRDRWLKTYHSEIYQCNDSTIIYTFLRKCAEGWQKMARKTIKNYISITDTSLCPTYLAEDERQWCAYHQDPAFAETTKELYVHNMPVVYTEQVIALWMQFFLRGMSPQTLDVIQPGSLL